LKLRRAFSLLEILVVLALLGLILALSAGNLRGGTRKASPHSMATALTAEIQAAQARAMAGHVFVVLSFPSNGQGVCQSFSRWEGLSLGQYRNGRNFAREFPDSSIFLGSWPVSSGAFSINRPPTGLELPGFDLTNWFSPSPLPTDFLLVFSPTGVVSSNDLPLLDGHYTLVVGNHISASPGPRPAGTPTTSPAPPYFTLQAVVSPQTIEVEPTGAVRLVAGLGAASGVQFQPIGALSQSAPGFNPAAPGGNQAPLVQAVQLSPSTPNLPGTQQGSIDKEDYLKLTVEASDADGDALTCRWTSTGGAFTSSSPSRMRWDAQKGRWVSTWSFRANPADLPGTFYDLNCEVLDSHGNPGTAAAGVLLSQKIEVRVKPFVVCTEYPLHGLYVCNVDGSDLKQIPLP
jgi:prepilin-type N-terminal cleavage/methylation domain-containing protein